mgnify:CR=1 FL=1
MRRHDDGHAGAVNLADVQQCARPGPRGGHRQGAILCPANRHRHKLVHHHRIILPDQIIIGAVFAFLQFTTFGMVVRAGMADRETVGLLGINIDRRFTIMFGIAAAVAGLAGVMYAPINSPNYHMGMDFLVLSFVVVVVGGMGSLPGAVLAGFLLGILESFASMSAVIDLIPGINQVIIYLVAITILLTRPRGLMGRKGVMED